MFGLSNVASGWEKHVVAQGSVYRIDFGGCRGGVIVTAPRYKDIPAVAAVPASGPTVVKALAWFDLSLHYKSKVGPSLCLAAYSTQSRELAPC